MQLLVLLMQIHVARTARSRKYELECIVGLLVCYAVMLITVFSSARVYCKISKKLWA